jgi:Zn-dependent protease with chaperone function
MALYVPFLLCFWLILAGLLILFVRLFLVFPFAPLLWIFLILWLGVTRVHTLWAARVLIRPTPKDKDEFEISVPKEGIPEVWALTKHVSQARGLPMPHDIRLHAGTVAHVYEDERDRRILVLGGLCLTMMSERSLSGVIAHELGHFGAGDTALSRAGRKRAMLMGELELCFACQRFANWNPLVWIVRGYHLLYLLVRAPHSRQQEFAADEHDAAQAGKQETAASLVYLDILDELPWTRFSSIAEAYAETGESLTRLFAEQRRRATSVDRSDWESAMSKALKKRTGLLDSRPCLRERLKAVGVSPKKALGYALDRMGAPMADRLRAWPGLEKKTDGQADAHLPAEAPG